MSLSQLIAQTVMTFKADTSDLKAKIKELTGLEKEAAQATLKSIEARNKGYESLAKGITKANAVLGVMNEALRMGGDAVNAYAENAKLQAAASAYSIDGLRSASKGLKTDLDLLRLAQVAGNSQYKLTQQQLENATAAMVGFEKAGFESAKVQDKVREAILKGTIEPLKDLGVNLEAAKGKGEQFNQVMKVLAEKARDAGKAGAGATDEWTRANVEYQNAIRDLKVGIGELVVHLAPLLSALAKAVGLIADVVGAAGGAISSLSVFSRDGSIMTGARNSQQWGGRQIYTNVSGMTIGDLGQVFAHYGDQYQGNIDGAQQAAGTAQSIAAMLLTEALVTSGQGALALTKQKRGNGGGYHALSRGSQDWEAKGSFFKHGVASNLSDQYSAAAASYGGGDFGGGRYAMGRAEYSGGLVGMEGAGDSLSRLAAQLQAAGQQNALEKMFGPISAFDGYAQAFGVLTGAAQAGFAAWIDGSMSAGAAIKRFFADSLKAMAGEMLGKAIQHGAYAIGSLAFGDMKGAATHGIAAAKFAAGAVAVGALAKMTGGGGASGGASAGGGYGASAPSSIGASGGGASVSGGSRTYIVGDAWHSDGSRRKNRDVARAVRLADQGEGRYVRVG